jgi:hypothetical protein
MRDPVRSHDLIYFIRSRLREFVISPELRNSALRFIYLEVRATGEGEGRAKLRM